MKSTRKVLGHSLLRSHRSLIRLLRTARFAALIRSLARSLTRSRAHGKEVHVYELNASISYRFNPLCIPLSDSSANYVDEGIFPRLHLPDQKFEERKENRENQLQPKLH